MEARLARSSADAGRDLGAMVAGVITDVVESAKREIYNQIRLNKNAK